MHKRIPKRPELPGNFEELIDDITPICFLPAQEEKVDVIFAFGTSHQYQAQAEHLSQLFATGISKNYIITGGSPHYEIIHSYGITEADRIYGLLPQDMRSECLINLETSSTNSVMNIKNSLGYLQPFANGRVGCVARNWAIGRQILHLKNFIANAEILSMPYVETFEDGSSLTNKNWHETQDGRSRLWGEILRLDYYSTLGDMAYPPDVKAQVNKVVQKAKP